MPVRKYWWAAVIAVIVYATTWYGYIRDWNLMGAADTRILDFFHDFGVHRPGWLSFWHDVSTLFGTAVLSTVGGVVAVVALAYRRWRIAAFLFMTVVLMSLVTFTAKSLVQRPRPSTMMDFESSTSFPSGHGVSITVTVFAVATVLWPGLSSGWRKVVAIAGVLLIALLLLARVILNVHRPSDVVAGCALGFLWYLLWVSIIPPWPGAKTESPQPQVADPLTSPSTGR